MASFIVVPKRHGRETSWEIIDTKATRPERIRMGHRDCEHVAKAEAEVLNGAETVYRATLAKLDNEDAF